MAYTRPPGAPRVPEYYQNMQSDDWRLRPGFHPARGQSIPFGTRSDRSKLDDAYLKKALLVTIGIVIAAAMIGSLATLPNPEEFWNKISDLGPVNATAILAFGILTVVGVSYILFKHIFLRLDDREDTNDSPLWHGMKQFFKEHHIKAYLTALTVLLGLAIGLAAFINYNGGGLSLEEIGEKIGPIGAGVMLGVLYVAIPIIIGLVDRYRKGKTPDINDALTKESFESYAPSKQE